MTRIRERAERGAPPKASISRHHRGQQFSQEVRGKNKGKDSDGKGTYGKGTTYGKGKK